jgi:ATP-dependent DNA ligase
MRFNPPEHGIELFQVAVELKLEGLVAKRASSNYLPGERTTDWRKIKRPGRAAGAVSSRLIQFWRA